jgi:putative transposase
VPGRPAIRVAGNPVFQSSSLPVFRIPGLLDSGLLDCWIAGLLVFRKPNKNPTKFDLAVKFRFRVLDLIYPFRYPFYLHQTKTVMPQSLSNVYVHIVFGTKHRQPLIHEEIQDDLYHYIAGICCRLDCPVLQIGGVADHVHVLCVFSRRVTISKLLQEVKQSSSSWIKSKYLSMSDFYWQDGYGVFGVSPSAVGTVKRYIANQKEHHSKATYQEEYLRILKEEGVKYDERCLW